VNHRKSARTCSAVIARSRPAKSADQAYRACWQNVRDQQFLLRHACNLSHPAVGRSVGRPTQPEVGPHAVSFAAWLPIKSPQAQIDSARPSLCEPMSGRFFGPERQRRMSRSIANEMARREYEEGRAPKPELKAPSRRPNSAPRGCSENAGLQLRRPGMWGSVVAPRSPTSHQLAVTNHCKLLDTPCRVIFGLTHSKQRMGATIKCHTFRGAAARLFMALRSSFAVPLPSPERSRTAKVAALEIDGWRTCEGSLLIPTLDWRRKPVITKAGRSTQRPCEIPSVRIKHGETI
jgi:hypothetical protein